MDLIERYFTLAAGDREEYLTLFAPDAVVEDENRTHRGTAGIRAWRAGTPPVAYRVLSVDDERATAEISGDFPGSPVALDFAFTIADDRIAGLTIRPV